MLGPVKDTVKEAVQLEDYDECGLVTVNALREALDSIQPVDGMDQEMIEFIVYYVYSRGGEDMQAVKYSVLFYILDNVREAKSVESRKRPESSSPA